MNESFSQIHCTISVFYINTCFTSSIIWWRIPISFWYSILPIKSPNKKSLWNGGLIKANAKCQQFLYKLDYDILSACVEKLGLWSQKLLEWQKFIPADVVGRQRVIRQVCVWSLLFLMYWLYTLTNSRLIHIWLPSLSSACVDR